jgi:hypothetical protein
MMGHFEKKKGPKVSNCHNLKVLGGGGVLRVIFETLEVKVKIDG